MTIADGSNTQLADVFSEQFNKTLSLHEEASIRLEIINRTLHHPSLSGEICGVVLSALLKETSNGDRQAWTVLTQCFQLPVVCSFVAHHSAILATVLEQAARTDSQPPSLAKLPCDRLNSDTVFQLAQSIITEMQRRISCTASDASVSMLSEALCRLCCRLETCCRVGSNSDHMHHTFIDQLMLPGLQLLAACQSNDSHASLVSSLRSLISVMLLHIHSDNNNEKDSSSVGHQLLAVCVAGEAAQLPAGAQRLLQLLASTALTEPPAAGTLLGVLLGEQLTQCAQCPLPVVAFWADWMGVLSACDSARSSTQPRPLLSSVSGVPACDWPASACLSSDSGGASLATRLSLLRVLLRALAACRADLSSSWRRCTLLQWLRACCDALLALGRPALSQCAAGEWFDCVAGLLSVSPLSVHLSTQLARVLCMALSVGDDCGAAEAADRFVCVVIDTYASLHQLARLIPRLVQAACDRSSPLDATRPLTLTPAQQRALGAAVTRAPLSHVINIVRSLVFHLDADVCRPHAADARDGAGEISAGAAAAVEGDGDCEGTTASATASCGRALSSPSSCLTLQLTAVVLKHCAVLDEDSVTPACRQQLPTLMASVCGSLQGGVRLAVRDHRGRHQTITTSVGVSPVALCLLVDACVAWRRVQTALIHYCRQYRRIVTESGNELTTQLTCLTQPLSPLTRKLLRQLMRLLSDIAQEPSDEIKTCADDHHDGANISSRLSDLYVEFAQPGDSNTSLLECSPVNAQPPLPVDRRLTLWLAVGHAVDFSCLLDWMSALSGERLLRMAAANADCRRVHVALLAVLAERLAALPVAHKRPRNCDSGVRHILRQLRTEAAPLLHACLSRAEHSAPLSPSNRKTTGECTNDIDSDNANQKEESLRKLLQQCLEQTGQLLSCGRSLSVSASTDSSDCDRMQAVLHAVSALQVQRLTSACASLCVCLLFVGALVCDSALQDEVDSGSWGSCVWRLLSRTVASLREPWPLLALGVDNAVEFAQRALPCRTPLRRRVLSALFSTAGRLVSSDQLAPLLARIGHEAPPLTPPCSSVAMCDDAQQPTQLAPAVQLWLEDVSVLLQQVFARGIESSQSVSLSNASALDQQLSVVIKPAVRCVRTSLPLASTTASADRGYVVVLRVCSLLLTRSAVARRKLATSAAAALPALCAQLQAAPPSSAEPKQEVNKMMMKTVSNKGEQDEIERRQIVWQCLCDIFQHCCCSEESVEGVEFEQLMLALWKTVIRDHSVLQSHVHSLLTAMTTERQQHGGGEQVLNQCVRALTKHTRRLHVNEHVASLWCRRLAVWRALATCPLARHVRHVQRDALNWLITWLTHVLARQDTWHEHHAPLLLAVTQLFSVVLSQRCVRLSDVVYTGVLTACCCVASATHKGIDCLPAEPACSALIEIGQVAFHSATGHARLAARRVPHLAQVIVCVARAACQLCAVKHQHAEHDNEASAECGGVLALDQLVRALRAISTALGADWQVAAPCVLADLLPLMQRRAVCGPARRSLHDCSLLLLDVCRDEVVARLRLALPPTLHQLFDDTLMAYKRFHKFTGRV